VCHSHNKNNFNNFQPYGAGITQAVISRPLPPAISKMSSGRSGEGSLAGYDSVEAILQVCIVWM
jgi:hypothetical protein